MRTLLPSSLPILLLLGTHLAGADDPPRTLLDKAIGAHGGERLERAKLAVRTAKGEIASFGASVPFTAEVSMQLPEQARWAFELKNNNQKIQVTLTVSPDKGWRAVGGAAKEMTPPEFGAMHDELYANWLATLLPLLDAKYDLGPLPETKVNNEPAVGVKVARTGKPEVKLYFARKNYLLIKAEYRGKEAGMAVTKEYIFGDHQQYEGVQVPTKMTVLANGKLIADWTITGYRFPDKLDPALFGKP